MAVMGNGDIVVGNEQPSTQKSTSVIVENLAGRAAAAEQAESIPSRAEHHCGAMSQQRGDTGMVSMPQKLVRLVGTCDPKTRPKT